MTEPASRQLRLFLCHASQDKPTVREIYRRLGAEGWMDLWLDEEKLMPGQEWDVEIERAVEQSDIVLVCLSNQSVNKEGYIQKELRFVLNKADEKPPDTIFVIPLRLDDCIIPQRLRNRHYVNYFPEDQRKLAYQNLLRSFRKRATQLNISLPSQKKREPIFSKKIIRNAIFSLLLVISVLAGGNYISQRLLPPSIPTSSSVLPFNSTVSSLSTTLPSQPSDPTQTAFVDQDAEYLNQVARDTWTNISSSWSRENHLPLAWRSNSEELREGKYTNPAHIGLYALSWIGAYELQRGWSPKWAYVEAEVIAVLDQLRAWQTGSQVQQPFGPNAYQNSVFYQWYWTSNTPPIVGNNSGDNHVVASVNNAWLAASLITIREYGTANGHLALAQKSDAILADMDFIKWYDTDTHLFSWGASESPAGGGKADYFVENRIINFVARSLGQLNADEFNQSMKVLIQPSATYNDIVVKNVAWDGSLSAYLAPALFIQEMDTPYGTDTIVPAIQAQIAYARNQGYTAWGLSDCYDIGNGGYIQQGALPAAMHGSIEARPGVVAPYASALALITPLAPEAVMNLRTLSSTFPEVYDPVYGFRDAVMAKPGEQYGKPSEAFSAWAQELTFLSIVNIETGFIWDYLYLDEGVRQAHAEMYPR